MTRLEIGQSVRISGTVASEYADTCGWIVALEQRHAGALQLAEYEVEFKDGARRHFLEFQLTPFPAEQAKSA
jgi:hypothetical protein